MINKLWTTIIISSSKVFVLAALLTHVMHFVSGGRKVRSSLNDNVGKHRRLKLAIAQNAGGISTVAEHAAADLLRHRYICRAVSTRAPVAVMTVSVCIG